MGDSVWCFVFCILILSDVARFNLGSEGRGDNDPWSDNEIQAGERWTIENMEQGSYM